MANLPSLPRILRLGSVGRDVRALQRALQAAGVRSEPPASGQTTFDEATDNEVRTFQKQTHLHVDGEVGENTYGALTPFYDERAIKLLNSVKMASPDTVRRKIAHAAFVAYDNAPEVRYTQDAGTRMDGIIHQRRPPDYPRYADCSSLVIWCYWAADAPDPNGSGFQWGSSASLKSKGEEVNVADVAMGDIAFYGDSRTDIDHVTVYVGNGRCISHGVESGPLLQRPLNYNGRLQSVRTYPL